MPGLRFVYLLALAIWLGGLVVLGSVTAPSVFEVLQMRAPEEGRVLAGAVFGAALTRFYFVSCACAALMISALVIMALIGPRPRPFAPRLALVGLMLVITAIVAVPIGWRISALQAAAGRSFASLPGDDPRKTSFDRLHGLSNLLLSLNVVGGLTLLFWEARERRH